MKGRKLLEALAAPHDKNSQADGDHAWRECRACLAAEEVAHQGAKKSLRALLEWVDWLTNFESGGGRR